MKTKLWIAIVGVASILGYLLGFAVSDHTGVEPGFFEIAESGGYGVVAEKKSAEGIGSDVQDYYKSLTQE